MKVEIVQFPANEAVEAIKNLKADAYLAVGPANSKLTIDAITASAKDGGEPTFLPIDASEALAQNHPAYEAAEIPAGSLGSADRPDDEVKTISFSHHIVARKGLSDATVAAFTRQLFAIRQSLKNDFPLAAKIETPDTDKDATIPVHPGAAAFVDGEEKTFLDRYSDYIWWSLMAFSAMGSAGAWFAGYLKQDERNTNTSQRERLLEMLKAARQSDSTDELDQLQAEADDLLLNYFGQGAYLLKHLGEPGEQSQLFYRLAPDAAERLGAIARGLVPGGLVTVSDLLASRRTRPVAGVGVPADA